MSRTDLIRHPRICRLVDQVEKLLTGSSSPRDPSWSVRGTFVLKTMDMECVEAILSAHPQIFSFLDHKSAYFAKRLASGKEPLPELEFESPAMPVAAESNLGKPYALVEALTKADNAACSLEVLRLGNLMPIDEYLREMRMLEGSLYSAFRRLARLRRKLHREPEDETRRDEQIADAQSH